MRSLDATLMAAALMTAAVHSADAASLQVTPLLLEIPAPGATSTLTVRNESPRPVNAQVRVFRWTQANGQDVLEPTDAVVASPPLVNLASRISFAVRIVRTADFGDVDAAIRWALGERAGQPPKTAVLAVAGPVAFNERRQYAEGPVHAGQEVGDGDTHALGIVGP